MSCSISWNWPSFQANGTAFVFPWGNTGGGTLVEARVQWPVPINCRIQNLRVTMRSQAGIWTFTVRQNGGDTALSVQVVAAFTGSDLAHSVLFSPGDLLSLKAVASGGGSGFDATISADFRPA